MTIEKIRVSVGVPVYNGENFLEAALDSILGQTYRDFELIISDNASIDRTQSICEHYAAYDPRIQYHRNQENRGAAQNYNCVFSLAVGDYFKWAAHDDLCAPEFLERCVEVLEHDQEVVLCYPQTQLVDEKGVLIGSYPDGLDLRSPLPHERFKSYHNQYRTLAKCNPIFGLIRADILRRTKLIGSYPSSDMILLGELALHGLFYEVSEPLFFRREHSQRSIRAYSDYGERATWFDPASRDKPQYPWWRWFAEHIASINRVQMIWVEKVRCYGMMGRWLVWNRKNLIRESVSVARKLSYKLPGPVRSILRFFWRLGKVMTRALWITGSNKSGT